MNTQVNNLNETMEDNFFTRWLHKQEVAFDETRYGHMVLFLTFQSCLGSIASMYNLQNVDSMFLLIVSASITMWSNSMFIVQAKAKWSLLVFYASIVLNTIILVFSLLY